MFISFLLYLINPHLQLYFHILIISSPIYLSAFPINFSIFFHNTTIYYLSPTFFPSHPITSHPILFIILYIATLPNHHLILSTQYHLNHPHKMLNCPQSTNLLQYYYYYYIQALISHLHLFFLS